MDEISIHYIIRYFRLYNLLPRDDIMITHFAPEYSMHFKTSDSRLILQIRRSWQTSEVKEHSSHPPVSVGDIFHPGIH